MFIILVGPVPKVLHSFPIVIRDFYARTSLIMQMVFLPPGTVYSLVYCHNFYFRTWSSRGRGLIKSHSSQETLRGERSNALGDALERTPHFVYSSQQTPSHFEYSIYRKKKERNIFYYSTIDAAAVYRGRAMRKGNWPGPMDFLTRIPIVTLCCSSWGAEDEFLASSPEYARMINGTRFCFHSSLILMRVAFYSTLQKFTQQTIWTLWEIIVWWVRL